MKFRTHCINCDVSSINELSRTVTVISALQFPDILTSPETWPVYLDSSYRSDKSPFSNCHRLIDGNLLNCNNPKIKFVEFSSESANCARFQMSIACNNVNYRLEAMVRHNFSHFTCAVYRDDKWYFIDDMSENLISISTVNHLYIAYPAGWFFAVYM